MQPVVLSSADGLSPPRFSARGSARALVSVSAISAPCAAPSSAAAAADPLWLAVVGKGGAGKSVVAGTLARVLSRRGHVVVAIDSDTMPGLTRVLGLEEPAVAPLLAAVEQDGGGRWRLRKGIGPVRAVQRFSTRAPDGVRLFQLGKVGADGLAPMLATLNGFLAVVWHLEDRATPRGWTIVGDLPAGLRHPVVGLSPYARIYVVVFEPTTQSALTARRVARFARRYHEARVLFVANKIVDAADRRLAQRLLGEPFYVAVPADQAVVEAERTGAALLDAAPDCHAVQAIETLADRLEGRTLTT